MKIEWHGPVPNKNSGRNGVTVDRIVLHTMITSIEGADATFHGTARPVSAHYGVAQDGRVWQWVSEADTAWQAGDFDFNLRSIGIEHEDFGDYNGVRPDLLYATSAALVRDICTRRGIPIDREHIVDHRSVSATACPDALDTDRIIREAQEDTLSQAEVDKINAHTDAKFAELYEAWKAIQARNLRGHDGFTPGFDTPVAPGDAINPEIAK